MSTTRRTIMRGLAILPTVTAPVRTAVPALPDPIFAAIAKRDRTAAAVAAIVRTTGGYGDAVTAAIEADLEATEGVADTVPTTIAGLQAMIDHLEHHFYAGDSYPLEIAFLALAESFRVLHPDV